jgi:hypothetical protein
MLLDILAVFAVTLISSLFLCTASVHGLPTSPSNLPFNRNHPSADLSSSLRRLHQHPVPSIDYDLGGDTSEMLSGESIELSTTRHHDGDLSTPSYASSIDASNVPFDFYRHPMPSKLLTSKFLSSLLEKHHQQKDEEQQQQKRSTSPLNNASPSLPAEFNFNSAVAAATFGDPSDPNSVINFGQSSDSARLSPSLTALVESNPVARVWLGLLLKKVMEEQPVPYIFKYGRRRKK